MNSVVCLKTSRWRSLLNEALDYYEQTSGHDHQGNLTSPVEHQWATIYLGGLTNIMRKDMAGTSERLASLMVMSGTHHDTIDATSFRAANQAIQNMRAIQAELEREVQKAARAPAPVRVNLSPHKGIAQIQPEDTGSDPDSWDEPTHPSLKSPAGGLPVIFTE